MYFTQEDYKKIENWLHRNSVKDTEFQEALPFTGKEIVTIVQDGHNRKVNIQEFINQLYKHGVEDFLNVTNTYRANNITLKEAIRLIPAEARKEGQVITFLNTEGNWEIYQFTGKLNQWNNTTLWNNPFDWEKFIVDSILPDEEDLTKSAPDAKGNAYLSLKDRKYEPDKYSGLGRKILRRRVVEIEDPIYGTQEKNLLLQADFAEDNTVYIVRYDFTLNGQDITLPDNSYIEYEGGSISDGNIIDRAEGLSRVVLKKNIVNSKNILTQDMISKPNTIYEIRYDFDLNSAEITIPEGCVLNFQGGSLNNGTILGDSTSIKADITKIFGNVEVRGTWNVLKSFPEWFGAIGDGITDDTAAFNKAIFVGCYVVLSNKEYFITPNLNILNKSICIEGGNNTIIVVPNDTEGIIFNIATSNVTLSSFKIKKRDLNPTKWFTSINIGNKAKHITINNIYFDNVVQCIHLNECSNIKIEGCVFDSSHYGIIQEAGYQSDDVLINKCSGINIGADMIEANCTKLAPSYNWIITNNTCVGSKGYNTLKSKPFGLYETNERRFCGITAIQNIIISNNIVRNLEKEAVGIEDYGGKIIISNNIFEDCYGYSIIYMINGRIDNSYEALRSADVVINGNQISNLNSNSATKLLYISGLDKGKAHPVIISNNIFFGHENLHNPIQNGNDLQLLVSNNYFEGFGLMFGYDGQNFDNDYCRLYNISFNSNIVKCKKFIQATKGKGAFNSYFSDNDIECTDTAILLSATYNGTNTIKNISIIGNRIKGLVKIENLANGSVINNILSEEMIFGVDYYLSGTNYIDGNLIGIGNIENKTQFSHYNLNMRGDSTARPEGKYKGQQYYNTSIGKPCWWTGAKWVDATGADV